MNETTDTQHRFLRAIAERVPANRVAELHLFPPIRQGGVESGVAVVVERALDEAESRIIVHTARYRLTLKGPSRGAWDTSIVAEADAPLVTVDAVVRGVQRRAGDVDDATRLTGDELIAIVGDVQRERTNTADAPVAR